MKPWLPLLFVALSATACSNYFSSYRTVYRIETTNGERYYSESEPSLNQSSSTYELSDLDGNHYELGKASIYKIEKFTHKK